MSAHHRRCDGLFAEAEATISGGGWDGAGTEFEDFRKETEKHFSLEEDVLFPHFETATGQTTGPTQMMRMEHAQMRQLFDQIETAIQARDKNQALGLAETLMMIMQQHNMKEERILYPMIDQVAGDRAGELLADAELA